MSVEDDYEMNGWVDGTIQWWRGALLQIKYKIIFANEFRREQSSIHCNLQFYLLTNTISSFHSVEHGADNYKVRPVLICREVGKSQTTYQIWNSFPNPDNSTPKNVTARDFYKNLNVNVHHQKPFFQIGNQNRNNWREHDEFIAIKKVVFPSPLKFA